MENDEKELRVKLGPGSGHSGGGAVEVEADLCNEGGAVTRGDAGAVVDDGDGGVLHLADGRCNRSARHSQGQVGLPQTVQATVLQSAGVTREDGIGDVAEDDFHVPQAGSHATTCVGIATGGNQRGLLGEEAAGSAGDDGGGVGCDAVHRIHTLVAVGNDGGKTVQLTGADELTPGVSLGNNFGEGVKH